jgi:hypothetical protein
LCLVCEDQGWVCGLHGLNWTLVGRKGLFIRW